MKAHRRSISASVAFLALVLPASHEATAQPPTQAAPTKTAESKKITGFKTPQECFANYAALKDSDAPDKDFDRFFNCLTAEKANLETGGIVIELEWTEAQGELPEDKVRDLFEKAGLEQFGWLEKVEKAQRAGKPIADEVILFGQKVTHKTAFAKKAHELLKESMAPRENKKPISHLQLVDVEIDGNQAVGTLFDPADPETEQGAAYFLLEGDTWRLAVPGRDWKSRLSKDEEEAIAKLSLVGEVKVDRTKRLAVFQSFRIKKRETTASQLEALIRLPAIAEIDLRGATISGDFAQRLMQRDRLEWLNVSGTNVTDDFLKLVKKFPQVVVIALDSKISKEAADKFAEECVGGRVFVEFPRKHALPASAAEAKKLPREYVPKHKFGTPEECFQAFCTLSEQDEPDAELLLSMMSTAFGKLTIGQQIFKFESMWRDKIIDDETARKLTERHGLRDFSMFDLLQVSDIPSGIGATAAYMKAADKVVDKAGYLKETSGLMKAAMIKARGEGPAEHSKPPSLTISDVEIEGEQAIATITTKSDQGDEERPMHFVLQNGSWRMGLPRLDWGPMLNDVEKEIVKNLGKQGTVDVDFGQRRPISHFIVAKKGIDEAVLLPMHKVTSWLEVNLHDSNVTDAFVEKLAASPKLRAIGLSGTNISDRSLEHIATLKNLKRMDLTNTDVSPEAVNRFREEHPDCDIAYGWNVAIFDYRASPTSRRPRGDAAVLVVGDKSCARATVLAAESLRTRSVFRATRKFDIYIAHCVLSDDESKRPKWTLPKDLPAIAIWSPDAEQPEFLPSPATPDQVAEAIENLGKKPADSDGKTGD